MNNEKSSAYDWIEDYHDAQEAEQLLKRLISFDSENIPGKYEGAIAKWIVEYLNSYGIEAQLVEAIESRPNVYAELKGIQEGPKIIYNGHLDVVPAGEDWTFPPYEATEWEEKIYGRGAADMKSGVAAMIYAAVILKKAGNPFQGSLHLFFNVDEEVTNLGMHQFLKEPITADFALISEPTNLDIALGHRGVSRYSVKTTGTAGHVATSDNPDNAISKMGIVLTELEKLKKSIGIRRDEKLGKASLNVTKIDGGSAGNIIPENCEILLDRRILPEEKEDEIFDEINESIQKIQVEYDFPIYLEQKSYVPASTINENNPFVYALQNVYQKITNDPPNLDVFGATCEAPFFSVYKGIPTIICGPGELSQAHTTDEYVNKKQYNKAIYLYTFLALELSRAETEYK